MLTALSNEARLYRISIGLLTSRSRTEEEGSSCVLRRRQVIEPGPVYLSTVEQRPPAFQPMRVGVRKEKDSFSGYV